MERHRAAVRARLRRSGSLRSGPGSISWTINREAIVVAGWGRAILMQLAHPAIAAGVHDHTAFRGSLLSGVRRLKSTVGAMLSLTFGDADRVIDAAAGINAIHDRVRGPVDEGGKATYSAHDPHLQRWVHATLLDSIPLTYERLVGPLTPRERDRYFQEAAVMEPLLGMPDGWLPRDGAQLDRYMREMIESGTLVVTVKARALARAMLYPAHWRLAWPAFRAVQLLTIGSLPPAIRAAYGFTWTPRDERACRRWTACIRVAVSLLPPAARQWPIARRNERPFARKTAWNLHMKLPILIAAAMLAGTPAYPQDKTAGVDAIFSWSTPGAPGCVVAASENGKVVVNRAYGAADVERGVPLTTSSVMDVASVVKQFVAASTLLLVEDGKLSLTEDIHKYIPELPDYGHKITLDHLLTHTSGIRDWTGLGPLTGREVDALTVTLRQRGLNFAPGEEWAYSNGGYVLLKEIVARVSGMPFADFARTKLFDPLGMKTTRYVVDMEQGIPNRALAYEKAGTTWRQDVQVGNQRGGGGALFSTASDLLIWNDALVNTRLGKFVTAKLHEPAKLNNGRTLTYARGLHIDSARGDQMIWHSGGSAGYSSMLARHPGKGVSVAVTCNAGDSAPSSQYARRVFDLLLPETAAAAGATAPAPVAAPVPAVDVSSRAGLFFSERTGQPLRLIAAGGRLRIQDGPALDTIVADRFRNPRGNLSVLSQAVFDLRFVSHDAFEITSTEGQVSRYRRAERYAPAPADLQAFAGRYGNDETNAVFEITPGQKGTMVKLNALGPLEFLPVDRDTFQLGGMILRFRRAAGGAVAGIDYSNPVVRNVRFTRVK